MGVNVQLPMTVFVDNTGAIELARNWSTSKWQNETYQRAISLSTRIGRTRNDGVEVCEVREQYSRYLHEELAYESMQATCL